MEFLVEFDVNVPDGAPASEVELVRLWKPPAAPGESKALGLYRADSEAQQAAVSTAARSRQ